MCRCGCDACPDGWISSVALLFPFAFARLWGRFWRITALRGRGARAASVEVPAIFAEFAGAGDVKGTDLLAFCASAVGGAPAVLGVGASLPAASEHRDYHQVHEVSIPLCAEDFLRERDGTRLLPFAVVNSSFHIEI